MIDLTGQTFGWLKVLERAENSKDGKARWLCECKCGTKKIIIGTHLRRGKIVSCGCYSKDQLSKKFLDDLTNKSFGKLTVLSRVSGTFNGKVKWKCQCECGSIIEVFADALRSGHTKSCGCIKSYGEEKISQLLNKEKINFKKQYILSDCYKIKNYPLKFDFAIFDDNNNLIYLIEYDGIQHFINKNCGWNNEKHLNELKERDKIKNDYCLTHNIPLIRIPYTEYNLLELKDLQPNTSKFLI